MRNIELKIILDNRKDVVRNIKKVGARFKSKLYQVDTYYHCKAGRLKVREINNKYFELVFYKRPNKLRSKISSYLLLKIKKDQVKLMKDVLSNALGEKNAIRKIRDLWLYKNTRIHIDKVIGLGKFLELETQVKKNDFKKAQNEHNEIIKLLYLQRFKKYNKSYSDLILQKY